MTDPVLERLRAQIATADREVLELVNRRLELVREIRTHKDATGVAFVDPGQEERLLARLREANGGPLSPDGVERLFRELLDLMKRESADPPP
ncbi:MAG TPA: chorismate mutase [Gaiellaceae bacterium]|nr:chorismate mutase [Gaiellaceae bacterium]